MIPHILLRRSQKTGLVPTAAQTRPFIANIASLGLARPFRSRCISFHRQFHPSRLCTRPRSTEKEKRSKYPRVKGAMRDQPVVLRQ